MVRLSRRREALEDVVAQGFDVLVDPQGDQLKVLVNPSREQVKKYQRLQMTYSATRARLA